MLLPRLGKGSLTTWDAFPYCGLDRDRARSNAAGLWNPLRSVREVSPLETMNSLHQSGRQSGGRFRH
jgi:hypothetical protein